MTEDRASRFKALMAEHDAAYVEYRKHLPPAQVLDTKPIVPRTVDWDAWERDKQRFDAARTIFGALGARPWLERAKATAVPTRPPNSAIPA